MGTSDEATARDRLIAGVAVLQTSEEQVFAPSMAAVDAAWEKAEAYVKALELFPLNTAKCPCCSKSVVLCVKHYQLHEPGKKCLRCKEEE